MAKYNPFAEKAGMRKVLEQKPSEEALRIAGALSSFGFDLKLLGSQEYVSDKLEDLTPEQLESLKATFIKNNHPRFGREFAANRHSSYRSTSAYAEGVRNASADRMTRLLKINRVLLQTKVYLFWRKSS